MLVSPLNLISTPLPVLNSLGLTLRVGLSSEDPKASEISSEAYGVLLSIYGSNGTFLERQSLGIVEPHRRKFVNVSEATANLVHNEDHLAVIHRVPESFMYAIQDVQNPLNVENNVSYDMYRAVVEYSFPEGGNGSVIYETPPGINSGTNSSNTLSFSSQTIISDVSNPYVVLIHHSTNSAYSRTATYNYFFHSMEGSIVCSGTVSIPPFGITYLDVSELIPKPVVSREKDPYDGLSAFNFVGYSEDAALLVLIVNIASSSGAVSVEHIHPPQTYLFPYDEKSRRLLKTTAQQGWKNILDQQNVKI